MRLRTFTAPDMPSAMRMVREALGEHAIILTSEADRGKGVKLTAAVEAHDDAPRVRPVEAAPVMMKTHPAAGQLRFEIQNILRFHNVPELFVAKIVQKASDAELSSILALHGAGHDRSPGQLFRLALEKLTAAYFKFTPLRLDGTPSRLMLIGPPGIGKTLTIAKLATKLAMGRQKVTVFTMDNKRAGGVEQLQAFTGILGLPLTVVTGLEDLRQQLKSVAANMHVLIDTAGCNPYAREDVNELKACASLAGIEPVMVMAAGGDSLEAIDMVESFTGALPIERLLITHADMARRFGGVLAAAAAHGLAFSQISGSSSIAEPLQSLDGASLAQLLLKYQL